MTDQLKEKIAYFKKKIEDVKKKKREFMMAEGEFNDEFGPWIKSFMGGQEEFGMVELIEKSLEKASPPVQVL